MNEYEYITIDLHGKSSTGKTSAWHVHNKGGGYFLGEIKWHGRWRQYAFFPKEATLYSEGCLVDIADFLNHARTNHRSQQASR